MNKSYIQQLADYIKSNLRKGYTLASLKSALINQGYSKISVEKSVELANQQLAEVAPIMREKPKITYKLVLDKKDVEARIRKRDGIEEPEEMQEEDKASSESEDSETANNAEEEERSEFEEEKEKKGFFRRLFGG